MRIPKTAMDRVWPSHPSRWLAVLMPLAVIGVAHAAPGDLDPSFGGGHGPVTRADGPRTPAVAIQPMVGSWSAAPHSALPHDSNSSAFCRTIAEISSNESVNGSGDGNTALDWLITGALTASLRAERSGNGSGRIYSVTVVCEDGVGSQASTQLSVTVPHRRP